MRGQDHLEKLVIFDNDPGRGQHVVRAVEQVVSLAQPFEQSPRDRLLVLLAGLIDQPDFGVLLAFKFDRCDKFGQLRAMILAVARVQTTARNRSELETSFSARARAAASRSCTLLSPISSRWPFRK